MTAPLTRRVLAGLALLVAIAAPASATEVQRVVSPGGIVAWLVSDQTVPLVAVEFAFRGGAAQDPPGKAGTTTLTAALLDEGAGDMDDIAFKRRLEETAVRLGFGADRDQVTGSMQTLKERRDEAFDLLAAALGQPRFDPEPFERIRTQLATRLRAREKEPETLAARLFSEATFPDHPYGRPVEGTAETLPSIAREDLVAFHRAKLARDNLFIGVVGAITAAELGPLLDRGFGALPAKADLAEVPEVQPRLGLTLTAEANEPQTIVRLAAPGVKRADPEYMPAFVMNHILGGGTFSSRLYTEVREKRGLAYSVGSSLVVLDHSALTIASTATRPGSAEEVLSLFQKAFADMAETGPTAEELASAKRYITGSYALRFDTSGKIAGQLVGLQSEGLPIDYFDRRNGLVEAVTIDDVRRVAKRLLSGPFTVLTVGPAQD